MTAADTPIDYKGYTITIHYDECPESPRTSMDNVGSLVFAPHRRYTMPNEVGFDFDSCGSWAEVEEALRRDYDAHVILAVSMIDHSGVAYSATRDFSDSDPGHWDSGRIGFVFCTKAAVDREWAGDEDAAAKYLAGEVDTYSSWASGDVYGYVVERPDGSDAIDGSCWGYYGYDEWEYMYSQGREIVDWELGKIAEWQEAVIAEAELSVVLV